MLTACCLLPEEEKHFEKNFSGVFHSVCALGGVLRAACILKKKNFLSRTFQEFPTECVRTGRGPACCLHPEEEKLFGKNFPGVAHRVCAHWEGSGVLPAS